MFFLVLAIVNTVVSDKCASSPIVQKLSKRVQELENDLAEIKLILESVDEGIFHTPQVPELPADFEEAEYRELLIGCGSRDMKLIPFTGPDWEYLVTLDYEENHDPDVLWDLYNLPLPFPDNSFDEIHAYEVLEHVGDQGDYKILFAQFEEFYRILKPNGLFMGTTPLGDWIWGDPSHTRYFGPETLVYLDQTSYITQVGKTMISDFSSLYDADFTTFHREQAGNFAFALAAVKPSRKGMAQKDLPQAEKKIADSLKLKLKYLSNINL